MEGNDGLDWADEEAKVAGTCAYCGRDIMDGETVYMIDDDWYCEDCVSRQIARADEMPVDDDDD